MREKNLCAKSRTIDNPYEIWQSSDLTWEWRVLKKYQIDDDKPSAYWFCGVKSPFTHSDFELGDVLVEDVRNYARKIK